jgi:hypothetical protein
VTVEYCRQPGALFACRPVPVGPAPPEQRARVAPLVLRVTAGCPSATDHLRDWQKASESSGLAKQNTTNSLSSRRRE